MESCYDVEVGVEKEAHTNRELWLNECNGAVWQLSYDKQYQSMRIAKHKSKWKIFMAECHVMMYIQLCVI